MLKFIGIGNLFNVELGNTCAYIKDQGKLLLVDCGTTAFARIKKLDICDGVNEVYIAITHLHPDHIGSLASLIFYLYYEKNLQPKIIIPLKDEERKECIEDFLTLQGVSKDKYNFVYSNYVEVFDNMTKFAYVEISHSDNLTSYAIEMKIDDTNIYYLGDNNDIEYLQDKVNSLQENDIIYTDCTTQKTDGQIHLYIEDINNITDKKQRKQICCMHFNSQEEIEEIKSMGYKVAEKEQSKQEYLNLIKKSII